MATSISSWQHVRRSAPEIPFACWWDVKTNVYEDAAASFMSTLRLVGLVSV